MGLLSFLFKEKKEITKNRVGFNELQTMMFSNHYSPETSATYSSVCDAHARHLSKLQVQLYKNGKLAEGRKFKDLTTLLTIRPNPYMNAPLFWETVARHYFMENNAILYLEWDYTNFKSPLQNIWVLDPDKNSVSLKSYAGKMYLAFNLDGQAKCVDLDDIAIISRNVDPSKFFGKSNKAIDQVLKVLHTSYEGAEQAIRTSAFIRFIVQTSTLLNDKVKEDKAKYFAETYLGKDSSGVVYIDSAAQVTQVSYDPKIMDAEQLEVFKRDVYEYLGSNEKITTASFNEEEWQAYYESSLEPFISKVAAELSWKILSREELNAGYRVNVLADKLQTASMRTRVSIASAYQKLPVYIPNVVASLLCLPESENGDKEYSNLNYVQTDLQNKYQVGSEEEEGPEEEQEEEINE